MTKTTMEIIRPIFDIPMGFKADKKCKKGHGTGQRGFDTVKKGWIRCSCVSYSVYFAARS